MFPAATERTDQTEGLLSYVRDILKCNEIKLDTSLECLALNVVLCPNIIIIIIINIIILILYNPPSHDV